MSLTAAGIIHKRFASSKGVRIEDREKLLAETVESTLFLGDETDEVAVRFKFKVGIK
jgi:hypothetical protein